MKRLLRATALVGRPVLTLGGESPLEVKDVVFDTNTAQILGFTLRKHGFFGGPVKQRLAWADVHGLGPDAVLIEDESCLSADSSTHSFDQGGDVIGDRILSESGTDLGVVVEVIVATGRSADVVGFEIEASANLQADDGHHVFIPMPAALAISGDNVVVPDAATDYIRRDLTGFGSAVEDFRSELTRETD